MKSLEIEWRKDKGGRGTVFAPKGLQGSAEFQSLGIFNETDSSERASETLEGLARSHKWV
jgi:hypothetical protein